MSLEKEAEKYLRVALGDNMNISTLKPKALHDIMVGFAKSLPSIDCYFVFGRDHGDDRWFLHDDDGYENKELAQSNMEQTGDEITETIEHLIIKGRKLDSEPGLVIQHHKIIE